jgi:biotin carboxyl carrier protein
MIIAPAEHEASATSAPGSGQPVLVDGQPTVAKLERHGTVQATLVEDDGTQRRIIRLAGERPPGTTRGVRRSIVVVDGWQVEVEVESERRATLRERARRDDDGFAHRGPTEIHAIIPGRVAAVSVVPGDPVVMGQPMLVIEAMKMQNELRAPRDGVVSSVAVGPGQTIEVGDLLLALQ